MIAGVAGWCMSIPLRHLYFRVWDRRPEGEISVGNTWYVTKLVRSDVSHDFGPTRLRGARY